MVAYPNASIAILISMPMAKQSLTLPTKASVSAFISKQPKDRQADLRTLLKMMVDATGKKPVMWGKTIIGCDSYHYRYATGREGDMPIVGLSPRAKDLTLYITPGFPGYDALMKRLGKHRTTGTCLYIRRLADVDVDVLKKILEGTVAYRRKKV